MRLPSCCGHSLDSFHERHTQALVGATQQHESLTYFHHRLGDYGDVHGLDDPTQPVEGIKVSEKFIVMELVSTK
jgi:hypothetical protein